MSVSFNSPQSRCDSSKQTGLTPSSNKPSEEVLRYVPFWSDGLRHLDMFLAIATNPDPQPLLDQSVSSVASTAKSVALGLLDDQRAELTQLREEIQEKIQQETNEELVKEEFLEICKYGKLVKNNIDVFLSRNFRIFPLDVDSTWTAVLPLVKNFKTLHLQLLTMPRGDKVFFYNKGTGNIVWSVDEMKVEDGPMKETSRLFEKTPRLLCLQDPLIELICKIPMPLTEDAHIPLASFPGASKEKEILECRMKKPELDQEMEKRERALEKTKQQLKEMKNRSRNNPFIEELEKEMRKRQRDLKFMERHYYNYIIMDPRNLDKKHEMDLEREKQELALEKAKEKLNQEIKNRLRNDPIIQQLEKEMEDRKRDLKFMERHYYNYIIMDPRKLDLDSPMSISFFDFVQSIFYVGKSGFQVQDAPEDCDFDAPEDRPYYYIGTQAQTYPTTKIINQSGASFTEGRIEDIWDEGFGPLVMHPFINISEDEALYREHCMIMARLTVDWDFLGRGTWLGWPSTIFGTMCLANKEYELLDVQELPIHEKLDWTKKERMEAGAFMLLKAFVQFRENPPEQLYPEGFPNMDQWESHSNSVTPLPLTFENESSTTPNSQKPGTIDYLFAQQKMRQSPHHSEDDNEHKENQQTAKRRKIGEEDQDRQYQ